MVSTNGVIFCGACLPALKKIWLFQGHSLLLGWGYVTSWRSRVYCKNKHRIFVRNLPESISSWRNVFFLGILSKKCAKKNRYGTFQSWWYTTQSNSHGKFVGHFSPHLRLWPLPPFTKWVRSTSNTWWFNPWPFWDGEFSWPFQRLLVRLHLGDPTVTLNHLVYRVWGQLAD